MKNKNYLLTVLPHGQSRLLCLEDLTLAQRIHFRNQSLSVSTQRLEEALDMISRDSAE
jgi:hypothetical protein